MRLSSRLSDEDKQHGEVEAIIDLEKYVFSADKADDAEDEDDRLIINEGDFIQIEIGNIFLPLYSKRCDDIVSFMSAYDFPSGQPSRLHCLVMSNKMISIDCQLKCGKYTSKDNRCKNCVPYVQAWFLIAADDFFSNSPTVEVIKKNYNLPDHIKLPVETGDKYSAWLAKAEIAHDERLGAGAAIYLRSAFETLVYEIGEESGIEKTFINKWSKEQYKSFEYYLVSVDKVCQIIPEQYSKNGYDLFRKLSDIAHGKSDEETALKEYAALKCLVIAIIENVKKKRAEIKNNQEIQKALATIGFIERGEDNGTAE